jgi:hypothetical protein
VQDVKYALQTVRTLHGHIPPLIRLVQSALHNESVIGEAVNAAKTLYSCPVSSGIQEVLNKELSASTTDQSTAREISSTPFGSLPLESYVLATTYFSYRIMLCGLINILGSLISARDAFDLEQVLLEDCTTVAALASCVEFARRETHTHPVKALRLQLPLQVAFGPWSPRAPLTTHYGLRIENSGSSDTGEVRLQEG